RLGAGGAPQPHVRAGRRAGAAGRRRDGRARHGGGRPAGRARAGSLRRHLRRGARRAGREGAHADRLPRRRLRRARLDRHRRGAVRRPGVRRGRLRHARQAEDERALPGAGRHLPARAARRPGHRRGARGPRPGRAGGGGRLVADLGGDRLGRAAGVGRRGRSGARGGGRRRARRGEARRRGGGRPGRARGRRRSWRRRRAAAAGATAARSGGRRRCQAARHRRRASRASAGPGGRAARAVTRGRRRRRASRSRWSWIARRSMRWRGREAGSTRWSRRPGWRRSARSWPPRGRRCVAAVVRVALGGVAGAGGRFAALVTPAGLASIRKVVAAEVAAVRRADPRAGVGVRGNAHRLFDTGWLERGRLELVAVVPRLDRIPFSVDRWGELHSHYRLACAAEVSGEAVSARLPMPVAVILSGEPAGAGQERCRAAVAAWMAPPGLAGAELGAWLAAGPLGGALVAARVAEVRINLQIVRWPSAVRPDLGGHAEYLMRSFWPGRGGALVPRWLENTPDARRIARD